MTPQSDSNSFLLPPPAPPERRGALAVILALSAVAHVVAFALFARAPAEAPATTRARAKTVVVLRGEVVTTSDATTEPGLRLLGYADVVPPGAAALP